jgi:hypothetical protein
MVAVKTKGEDGNVTRDTHHVNLEQAVYMRCTRRWCGSVAGEGGGSRRGGKCRGRV